MAKSIYLDNQATTPVDPEVINVMLPFFQEKFGNASSIHHSYGLESKEAVERARKILAESINANTREIIFTSGATEAINLAIKGIAGRYKNKRHIITQVTEHSAVLDTYRSMGRKGWDVTILPVNSNGMIEPKSVRDAITDETVLISIMHANNEIGSIQPIKEIGALCKKHNIIFHVDAAQSLGKIDIDVINMNIDLLSISAHKVYGPKGVGALYIKNKEPKINIKPLIIGGGQEKNYRSGTLPTPLIVGFGKACEILSNQMLEDNIKIKKLASNLVLKILSKYPKSILNGSRNNRIAGNINFTFPFLKGMSILRSVSEIAISSGSACNSSDPKPSHVLTQIGRSKLETNTSIRIGIGRFNTENDINIAADAIIKAIDNKI